MTETYQDGATWWAESGPHSGSGPTRAAALFELAHNMLVSAQTITRTAEQAIKEAKNAE